MIQLNQQKTQLVKRSKAPAVNVSTEHNLCSPPPRGFPAPPGAVPLAGLCARGSSRRRPASDAQPGGSGSGVGRISPFGFGPMWFHTSTPQVHFELQVQMNATSQHKRQ